MLERDIRHLLNDPLAQELLAAKIPVRLAYTGLDGTPRVIPIWFHWNGVQFIIGILPHAPKVRALVKNPQVALTIDTNTYPPHILLVRGIARVEVIDGVAPEFLEAARKYLGEERAWRLKRRHKRSTNRWRASKLSRINKIYRIKIFPNLVNSVNPVDFYP